ncbi:MAG: helix-turn-helix domain-containing protein [Gammaproteobacteria bacterium]|jgi:DNA-binding NtrC family response regulator
MTVTKTRHELKTEFTALLERAVLLADGNRIMPEHLVDICRPMNPQTNAVEPSELITLAENERRYLIRALAACPTDRQALANKLGISKRTLFRKLDEIKAGR